MSEIKSESLETMAILEASNLLRAIAEPRPVGDSVKAAIRRAARKVGLTFSRAKSIWYGDAHTISSVEMDALRKQVGQYETAAHNLRIIDEDFYSSQIDDLERIARELRHLVGTRTCELEQ